MREVFEAPLPPAIVIGFWCVCALICLRGLFALWRDIFGAEVRAITLREAMEEMARPRQIEGSDDWVSYAWNLVPAEAPQEKGPAPTIGTQPEPDVS